MRKPIKRIRDARRHPKLKSHFVAADSPLRPRICPGYGNEDVHFDAGLELMEDGRTRSPPCRRVEQRELQGAAPGSQSLNARGA